MARSTKYGEIIRKRRRYDKIPSRKPNKPNKNNDPWGDVFATVVTIIVFLFIAGGGCA